MPDGPRLPTQAEAANTAVELLGDIAKTLDGINNRLHELVRAVDYLASIAGNTRR